MAELDIMDGKVDVQVRASGNLYLGRSSFVSEEIYQVRFLGPVFGEEDWFLFGFFIKNFFSGCGGRLAD